MEENEEYSFDSSINNLEGMSQQYDCCIIGESQEGQNIYSWKKMIKVVKSFGLDEIDAEDFLFRTSICFPDDIIIMMDN
jgi:hypothetical protein